MIGTIGTVPGNAFRFWAAGHHHGRRERAVPVDRQRRTSFSTPRPIGCSGPDVFPASSGGSCPAATADHRGCIRLGAVAPPAPQRSADITRQLQDPLVRLIASGLLDAAQRSVPHLWGNDPRDEASEQWEASLRGRPHTLLRVWLLIACGPAPCGAGSASVSPGARRLGRHARTPPERKSGASEGSRRSSARLPHSTASTRGGARENPRRGMLANGDPAGRGQLGRFTE